MLSLEELAKECVGIEKAGGDVLDYLREQGKISPRGTWWRIQKEILGRKDYQMTDGKPDERRQEKAMKKLLMTPEVKAKAIRIAMDGGDPRPYLGNEIGMKDPITAWWKIRAELKDTDPETFKKLPERLPGKGAWTAHNDVFHNPMPKPDKGMPKAEPVKAAEPLTPEAGKNCVPDMAEGMKITNPVAYDGMTIRAVQGTFGTYRYDPHGEHGGYIDFDSMEGDELSMPVWSWREFLREIRKAAAILGVEP